MKKNSELHNDLKAITDAGEPLTITVRGDCMSPLLVDGQQLIVKKYRHYYPGDVLVFVSFDERLLAHRFLGWVTTPRAPLRAMTKADNTKKIDCLINPNKILGKVTSLNGQASQASQASQAFGQGQAYQVRYKQRYSAFFHYLKWFAKLSLSSIARS